MNTLSLIKFQVQNLFKTHPNVHMNVTLPGGKIHLRNHPVTITAVYPNIFRVEDRTGNSPLTYTVQYVELMMGHIEIAELLQKQDRHNH